MVEELRQASNPKLFHIRKLKKKSTLARWLENFYFACIYIYIYDILRKRVDPQTSTVKLKYYQRKIQHTQTEHTHCLQIKLCSEKNSGNRCAIITKQQWTVICIVIMNTIIFSWRSQQHTLQWTPYTNRTHNLLPPTPHSDDATTAPRHPITCKSTENAIPNTKHLSPTPPST